MPGGWVRTIGRWQFKHPLLRRVISHVGRKATFGEGVIRDGVAAGLKFDATGGNPGYLLGTSGIDEQAFLASHVCPGMTTYDIGANIGFYSVLLGRLVGANGHVVAFEPHPECAQQARRNLALNQMTHATVIEAAVADQPGKCCLDTSTGENVNNSICRSGESRLEVESVTLDDLLKSKSIPTPDLIKLDIEGAELHAFRGAMQLIEAHRPLILCEVHWLGQRFLDFFAEKLEPLGYQIKPLEGDEVPVGPIRWHAVLESLAH